MRPTPGLPVSLTSITSFLQSGAVSKPGHGMGIPAYVHGLRDRAASREATPIDRFYPDK